MFCKAAVNAAFILPSGRKEGEKMGDRLTGILDKAKAGFGFVRQEEGGDIFVAGYEMNGAMNGDLVEVDLIPEYLWERSREGIVHNILERNTKEVVGTLQLSKKFGFVVADDKKNTDDLFISKANLKNAKNGDKVVAKIIKYPTKDKGPEGVITEIVARKGEKGGEIKALMRAKGLYETFPSRASAEAKARSKEPVSGDVLEGRRDLRNKKIITIDGASSKDLDDAVCVDRLPNGNYLLGVHIADVSHYVGSGGYLDQEALKRGNSVYLLTRVVPMLPKVLSNGICSLNEGEDRLTLSCEMEINEEGEVVNYDIFESVINSKARMVYDDVSDILEFDVPALKEKYSFIYEELKDMERLAAILREKRKQMGSLDFDFDEAEIELDENEIPVHIGLEERRVANRLIEEFMLAANETVAEHFFWMNYPFVYRVHEKPDTEKVMELKAFLKGFKINLPGNPDNIHPKTLNEILEKVKGEPYENIVSTVMLRTMKKAFYSTDCTGHFGLAFKYYCHFTSPIRRYPDLMIHRIIKANLKGQVSEAKLSRFKVRAEEAARIASVTERTAQEAEREVEKMKKAEYMEQRVGCKFDGVISGVTNFGIYVELPDTVEGMVRLESIQDDYYNFIEGKYMVIGELTGKTYSLGDRVRVKCVKANPEERQIDFVLVNEKKKKKKDAVDRGKNMC